MSSERCEIVLVRNPEFEITLEAPAVAADLAPEFVKQLLEAGLITAVDSGSRSQIFDMAMVPRVHKIIRLRRTLGINLAGVSVVLDLTEKIETLHRENRMLRSRI